MSLGLLVPPQPLHSSGLLSPEASGWTPYLRQDFVSSQSCHATPAACWTPLLTSKVGYADVQPPGSTFPQFEPSGATSDLGHVVLNTDSKLYEWSAAAAWEQRLAPLSVPPAGGEPCAAELGDGNHFGMGNDISHDGSRAFFKTESQVNQSQICAESVDHLYVRDTAKGETLQLDVVQPGAEQAQREAEESAPVFQVASADGSRVLFTDRERLTADSGTARSGDESGDLYLCEVHASASTGKLECALSDLTPKTGTGESAEVQGLVLGASEDGSYVYFAANAVLAPGASAAVAGGCGPQRKPQATCSLYVAHESGGAWQTTFIAPLSAAGNPITHEQNSDWQGGNAAKTSRVSPNGQWLAFTSNQPMPGYDNRDAASGQRDVEVYLYDAQAEQEGRTALVCASCNPTGARPAGELVGEASHYVSDPFYGAWRDQWVAGVLVPLMHGAEGGDSSNYQSRYLSDSGRLFFDSHDGLVPHDKNRTWDVYEYEPPAIKQTPASDSCTSGSDSYSERSGGCVSLISSGASGQESALLDASENGDDVFFVTAARLLGEDYDSAYDVYDAHVCSAQSPCAAAAVSPPACTTSDSCRAAPGVQPSLFGPPPSATFAGAGNLAPPASKPAVKHLTKTQQLSRALNSCHKRYGKSRIRRVKCERQAHVRYGARKSRASRSRKANASRRGRR